MNLKFLLPLTLTLTLATPVFAQTATPDASLRDSVKQKVNEELAQIKQSISKKAFLGEVTGKSEATLTLTSYANQTKSVLVSTETSIKLKNGKDGTPIDVKPKDYILVMGDVDGVGAMVAKRLLIISAPATDTRKVVFGNYSDLTATAKVTSTTTYTKVDAGKVVKAKSTDFKATSQVIAVTKSTTITSLHLLPPSQ
jgi:hypothetical protein